MNKEPKHRFGPLRFFETVFKIAPREFALVQIFFLYMTSLGIFYTIGATSGDTMLLSKYSSPEVRKLLPWVYIGIATASVVITWLYDLIQGRLSRMMLLVVSQVFLGATVFVFSYFIGQYPEEKWIYYTLVVWLEATTAPATMTTASIVVRTKISSSKEGEMM